jgi:hypothetical protein
VLAAAAIDLGRRRAARARAARVAFHPSFTKEEYLAALDSQFVDRTMHWEPPEGGGPQS